MITLLAPGLVPGRWVVFGTQDLAPQVIAQSAGRSACGHPPVRHRAPSHIRRLVVANTAWRMFGRGAQREGIRLSQVWRRTGHDHDRAGVGRRGERGSGAPPEGAAEDGDGDGGEHEALPGWGNLSGQDRIRDPMPQSLTRSYEAFMKASGRFIMRGRTVAGWLVDGGWAWRSGYW